MRLTIVLVLFLSSCCQTKKEYYLTNDNTGNKIKLIYQKDQLTGKKCGMYILFFENGDTCEVAHYKKDLLHGNIRFFYESRQKQLEANYINDQPNGLLTEWYENGELKHQVLYNSGKLWGIQLVKDSLGNVLNYGKLENGNGYIKKYYPNGSLMNEGQVRSGLKNGYWKFYTDTGILSDSILFENGLNKYSTIIENFY